MNEQVCATCRFFKSFNAFNGWCHRYPPREVTQISDAEGVWERPKWPRVEETSWCGDYEENPAPQQEKP